ncbi:C39 family peptidase [Nocardioides ungokensis]|uniref:C39 family peptidase n=1 Tax=Nocardioides ungokensis TaxID=1643322 RepID=UPI0015DF44AC|nr:C39 family peptidase [Nocardioides ungokensis]
MARPIAHTQWDTTTELRTGTTSGARVTRGRVELDAPTAHRSYDGRQYDVGRWVSPWVSPGFGLTQLVSSWSATTPGDSWLEVQVRGRAGDGGLSSWDVLGRWTSGDTHTVRTSVSGQSDDLASVNVDTWVASRSTGLASYQVRVLLLRRTGASTASPSLDQVGAMSSRLPSGSVTTSASGPASKAGTVLDVPRYSQMAHRGHYPRWGGGGEAWCSPTSTSMVLGYYDALPDPSTYAWVPAGHTDPWVDEAARSTYDAAYQGTGNWPFNTAYAAPLAGHAFVTRLRSLREAELFIDAGIPLVASISFGSGELTGAPISASNGTPVGDRRLPHQRRRGRQRPGRPDPLGGAAHLRPRPVRERLAPPLRRAGLRDPRRRPPAPRGRPHQLVTACRFHRLTGYSLACRPLRRPTSIGLTGQPGTPARGRTVRLSTRRPRPASGRR